jgi:hypothetical protein
MRIAQGVIGLAVLFAFTAPAAAQSLGDLATQEKQKRQGKPSRKVITENELGRAGTRGTMSMTDTGQTLPSETPVEGASTATADAAPPAEGAPVEGGSPSAEPAGADPNAPSAKAEKTEEEIRGERRAEYQKRLDTARNKVNTLQKNVDLLQRDLNDVSGGVYTERRNALLKQHADQSAALKAAQDELAALEEEGRRSGFPR